MLQRAVRRQLPVGSRAPPSPRRRHRRAFAREVFTGVYASDMGLWQPDCAGALRLRADARPARPEAPVQHQCRVRRLARHRPIELRAKSAVFSSLADVICVSGPLTGQPADQLGPARRSRLRSRPPGPRQHRRQHRQRRGRSSQVADGCVIGTHFKVGGDTWNPVDGERVRRLHGRGSRRAALSDGADHRHRHRHDLDRRHPDRRPTDGRWRSRSGRATLSFASMPAGPRRIPAQWWRNGCAMIARAAARSRPPGRGHRRASASPACCPRWFCWTTPAGAAARASSRATAAPRARSRSLPPRSTRRPSCGAPATASTSSWWRPSCAGSSGTSRRCSRRIATVFGSYDYINWRLTGVRAIEHNWALEAGFVDLADGAIDRRAGGARPHRPALCCRRSGASHEVIGEVTREAAAATGLAAGTPVVAGCADHVASAFVAGIRARRRPPAQVRRRRRHPARDRRGRGPTRACSSTITSCPACSCRTAAWPARARC